MTWIAAPIGRRNDPRADPQARAGHGQVPGRPSVEDQVGRVVGHDGATLGRGPRDGVRGVGAPPPPAAPVAGRKRRVRGGAAPRQPPAGDARSVATRSKLACFRSGLRIGSSRGLPEGASARRRNPFVGADCFFPKPSDSVSTYVQRIRKVDTHHADGVLSHRTGVYTSHSCRIPSHEFQARWNLHCAQILVCVA